MEAKKRLSALLVLLGLGVLALLAGYFTFLIRSIDVVGTLTRYTKEELIEASGLKLQRHILQQDLDQARENLEKDPYLNTTVKYVFPNRIRITVEERNRAGAVAWGPNKEYIAVIDREGVVLESDASSYPGLPLVQGLIITGANPGARVGDPADEQVQSMLDVLSTLEELGLADKIKTVDLTETMGISLYTPEGYRIEVGDTSDLLTKLNRLKKNYTAIMDKATQYMGRGADAVTIYLYSKNGVVISPHEVGYVAASPSPDATFFAPVQNNPDEPAVTPAPNLPAEPQAPPGRTPRRPSIRADSRADALPSAEAALRRNPPRLRSCYVPMGHRAAGRRRNICCARTCRCVEYFACRSSPAGRGRGPPRCDCKNIAFQTRQESIDISVRNG